MSKLILYITRWQLSTPILAICIGFLPGIGFKNVLINTIIANFIGALIFFPIDTLIFKTRLKPKEAESVRSATENIQRRLY